MIFINYEQGSKGYVFWDQAHQCIKISCDVKFNETQFPAKEEIQAQPDLAPLSDCQIPESDNESNSLRLDLVKLAQTPTRPPIPGESASRQPVMTPQPPVVPPPVPWHTTPLPDVETALPPVPTPRFTCYN